MAILDKNGEPAYLLGISEDITDKKNMEDKLRIKTDELSCSEAEKEQLELFAQLVSHDLQAPLQKIIGFSELLEEHINPTLDDRGRHFLVKVKEGAQRMCQLMDSLVDFATVVTRRESFKSVDLNEITKGVLLDLEMRISQSKAKITLDKPLPSIEADKTQMRELLYNLLSNAIKFHPQDRSPRVRIRGRIRANGLVNLVIADNGIGFDMKHKGRIFKPFERLCRREDFEGMGIGLAICKKIALRHKGDIRVKSISGKGTVFMVTLPKEQRPS
jgi:light-regulated signal transduction histidine kinase (bacteriophytochrome)